ncbi:hypothetical protein Trco_000483 [Trichoderma cornu-damae]|uniref:Uncharacterized protein n=1 Tax=Trichoderma cornu-damae TaxID=654480 RepID=A0A9P8TZB2_9HYPO|nr:hypothetical protein Trco_000483 [Trichoderma cornu-damae]
MEQPSMRYHLNIISIDLECIIFGESALLWLASESKTEKEDNVDLSVRANHDLNMADGTGGKTSSRG